MRVDETADVVISDNETATFEWCDNEFEAVESE